MRNHGPSAAYRPFRKREELPHERIDFQGTKEKP
jgi:hypothetical protein